MKVEFKSNFFPRQAGNGRSPISEEEKVSVQKNTVILITWSHGPATDIELFSPPHKLRSAVPGMKSDSNIRRAVSIHNMYLALCRGYRSTLNWYFLRTFVRRGGQFYSQQVQCYENFGKTDLKLGDTSGLFVCTSGIISIFVLNNKGVRFTRYSVWYLKQHFPLFSCNNTTILCPSRRRNGKNII